MVIDKRKQVWMICLYVVTINLFGSTIRYIFVSREIKFVTKLEPNGLMTQISKIQLDEFCRKMTIPEHPALIRV